MDQMKPKMPRFPVLMLVKNIDHASGHMGNNVDFNRQFVPQAIISSSAYRLP